MEAEIRALPDITDPDFHAAARAATAAETLVHAIRRRLRAGDAVNARALGAVPVTRVDGLLARTAAAQFPDQADDRHELRSALAERL